MKKLKIASLIFLGFGFAFYYITCINNFSHIDLPTGEYSWNWICGLIFIIIIIFYLINLSNEKIYILIIKSIMLLILIIAVYMISKIPYAYVYERAFIIEFFKIDWLPFFTYIKYFFPAMVFILNLYGLLKSCLKIHINNETPKQFN